MGHEIHKEQPQLVVDAIREVVDAVRRAARISRIKASLTLPRKGRAERTNLGRRRLFHQWQRTTTGRSS
jgi:hypothetical protein